MVLALIIVAAVVGGVIAYGGGNTVEGFGQDMKNTGNQIEQHTGQNQ